MSCSPGLHPRARKRALTLATARAARLMKGMIDRGFTSVRDTGGADWGIKEAVEKNDIPGPRLFIAGAAIGPTGGHSDPGRRTDFGARGAAIAATPWPIR